MITPTYNRIVARRMKESADLPHGLVMPESWIKPSPFVEIIAIGPGKWNKEKEEHDPMPVKPGDKAIVFWKAGTHVEINGEDYIILIDDQIDAIVEDFTEEHLSEIRFPDKYEAPPTGVQPGLPPLPDED